MRPIRHTLNQASNEVTFGDNSRDTETDLKYSTTKLKYFEIKREKYPKIISRMIFWNIFYVTVNEPQFISDLKYMSNTCQSKTNLLKECLRENRKVLYHLYFKEIISPEFLATVVNLLFETIKLLFLRYQTLKSHS